MNTHRLNTSRGRNQRFCGAVFVWAFFLATACSPDATLRLRVGAGPTIGALDSLIVQARNSVERTVSQRSEWQLDKRDLKTDPLVVDIAIPAGSSFGGRADVVFWGRKAGADVASGIATTDLAGTGTVDVILIAMPAGCDEDGDGFKPCASKPACCSEAEQEGFADCDDGESRLSPFALEESCQSCADRRACLEPVPDAAQSEADDVLPDSSPPQDVPPEDQPSTEASDAHTDDDCVPDCKGKLCGPDGCGGSCGECEDGNRCNGVKKCSWGGCTSVEPWVTCEASDKCHDVGVCIPSSGQCTNPPKTCPSPSSPCLVSVCDLGSGCGFAPKSCDDADPTTDDVCVEETGACVSSVWSTPGFLRVENGSFWMGSPDGQPCLPGYTGCGCPESGMTTTQLGRFTDEALHYVTLSRSYEMQETETTQGQWKSMFGGWNPSLELACGDDCPVEGVSWFDALAFANALSIAHGLPTCYAFAVVTCAKGANPSSPSEAFCMDATLGGIKSATVTLNGAATPYACIGYRLPTEAEWEYAYRATSLTAFYPSAGNDGTITNAACADPNLEQMGWYCGNAFDVPHPVKAREANAWGLYDMAGNVAEWCWDPKDEYDAGTVAAPVVDPSGVSAAEPRPVRGGAYLSGAGVSTASYRAVDLPANRKKSIGFRLVRSVKP